MMKKVSTIHGATMLMNLIMHRNYMKYFSLALLLLITHLPLYLMDEYTPLRDTTSLLTSCKMYLNHIGAGAALGITCGLLFTMIFTAYCDHYNCTRMPETSEIIYPSLGIGALAGSLVCAGIAKYCPCKRQESE